MNESGIKSVLKKLYFFCLPTQPMRARFIKKHAHEFKHIGEGIFWQSRYYPADPARYLSAIIFYNRQCVVYHTRYHTHGKFDDLVEKRKNVVAYDKAEEYWEEFYKKKSQL